MAPLPTIDAGTFLDGLIDASREARSRAQTVIARSCALGPRSERLRAQSVDRRLASRRRCTYATLDGVVEDRNVRAVVRRDGSVDGDAALLARARLVVALGDTFDQGRLPATLGVDPLMSVLTLTRACDEARTIQMGPPAPFELHRG